MTIQASSLVLCLAISARVKVGRTEDEDGAIEDDDDDADEAMKNDETMTDGGGK